MVVRSNSWMSVERLDTHFIRVVYPVLEDIEDIQTTCYFVLYLHILLPL